MNRAREDLNASKFPVTFGPVPPGRVILTGLLVASFTVHVSRISHDGGAVSRLSVASPSGVP